MPLSVNSLSDVYSVAKLHNMLLLKIYLNKANVVYTGQTTMLQLLLKSCIDDFFFFLKIYVTLNKISWYKISNFGPLNLNESRYIMKDVS